MSWFRRLAIPLTFILLALFMVTASGCKVTKMHKEYDDNPYEPDVDPNPDEGPGPHPPT